MSVWEPRVYDSALERWICPQCTDETKFPKSTVLTSSSLGWWSAWGNDVPWWPSEYPASGPEFLIGTVNRTGHTFIFSSVSTSISIPSPAATNRSRYLPRWPYDPRNLTELDDQARQQAAGSRQQVAGPGHDRGGPCLLAAFLSPGTSAASLEK